MRLTVVSVVTLVLAVLLALASGLRLDDDNRTVWIRDLHWVISLSSSLQWLPRYHRCKPQLSLMPPGIGTVRGNRTLNFDLASRRFAVATTTVWSHSRESNSHNLDTTEVTAQQTVAWMAGPAVLASPIVHPMREAHWYSLTESNCHCHRVKVASSPLNEESTDLYSRH